MYLPNEKVCLYAQAAMQPCHFELCPVCNDVRGTALDGLNITALDSLKMCMANHLHGVKIDLHRFGTFPT